MHSISLAKRWSAKLKEAESDVDRYRMYDSLPLELDDGTKIIHDKSESTKNCEAKVAKCQTAISTLNEQIEKKVEELLSKSVDEIIATSQSIGCITIYDFTLELYLLSEFAEHGRERLKNVHCKRKR